MRLQTFSIVRITACIALASFALSVEADDVPDNAKPGIKYVGTEKCIDCHKEQHGSYLDTTHSRSAERVQATKEPASSKFEHELSGHKYEVLRRDGELIHREILRGSDGQELATTDVPIAYTIGSGAHGKSYVYRSGSFFGQSPISWFKETETWKMSPGYDSPFHPSFRRKVAIGCFFCHVGSIDRQEGNPNTFTILEEKIGCERCHGPGELHVAKYTADPNAQGDDRTIVNPTKLPRELSEAICQQCHLQAAGKSHVTGKDEWDYRPGLRLSDFRIDYQYRLGDDTMKIVGHVEQLHQSKCYTQTETLTCITCHDPHHTPPPEDSVAFYRSVCLKCHEDDACGKPLDHRMEVAKNDCAICHMPKEDTDVTHAAFRHHRIGMHSPKDKNAKEVVSGLTSVLNTSYLPELEQERCKAIAKFQVSQAEPGNPSFKDYGIEAAKALIGVKQRGKFDADTNSILAMLARDQGQAPIAANLAQEVLDRETKPTRARIEAARLLALLTFQRGDKQKAVELYRQVTSYHRDAFDMYHLGMAEQNAGNTDRAIKALQGSVEIDPSQVDAHGALAAILKSIGRKVEAAVHETAASENSRLMQGLMQKAAEARKK